MRKNGYTLIANLGDVNPLQYGGFLVWKTDQTVDGRNVYEAEVIDVDESNENAPLKVYRFYLDGRQWLGDVELKRDVLTLDHYCNAIPWSEWSETENRGRNTLSACPHSPSQYTEFWDSDIESIAETCGISVEELREAEVSTDPVKRAAFHQVLTEYYGLDEFDQDPLELTPKEALKRYSRTFAGARRRKQRIDIYAH